MKWNNESWASKRKRLEAWHAWFAWHPVQIGDKRVWLETVERKGEVGYEWGWHWEYREIE